MVFDVGNNELSTYPSDPTGAVGPHHYIAGWNSAFKIFDKEGNALMEEASLSTLFPGNDIGDPIVLYDAGADRFIITEFDNSPQGLNMAISKGPDPLNDGWYIYTTGFETNRFPDYCKFSIWHDGYYVTANIPGGGDGVGDAVFVIERDKMLLGEDAQFLTFPLPEIKTDGFYSPQAFNVGNKDLPTSGDATIVYMQDDAWEGVDEDHLKLWNLRVDWDSPSSSSISSPQIITTTDFTGVFDGGETANLPQPQGPDIDALQATIMNQAQFRRFDDYNSAVFNFVVDVDGNETRKLAGIRWYELRQTGADQPWSIYQEGTYVSPNGLNAFAASMSLDREGNIGMGYSTVGVTSNIAINYTGRYNKDALNTMTIPETLIAQSSNFDPEDRYADYTHLTVDPQDDKKFWFISEYFNPERQDVVGVFQLEPPYRNDVGVIDIIAPVENTVLGNDESVTVVVGNYGLNDQVDFPVSYSVGGSTVTEIFSQTLSEGETANFTFSQTADLSTEGEIYEITSRTLLNNDEDVENDTYVKEVRNLYSLDVGVSSIISPVSGSEYDEEDITITIYNYGGIAQKNFPVTYQINNDPPVSEIFTGTVAPLSTATYTFSQTKDFSELGSYDILAETQLEGDSDSSNNSTLTTIIVDFCMPQGDCISFMDGVVQLDLQGTSVTTECNELGYAYDSDVVFEFDIQESQVEGTLQVGFSGSGYAIFIDFDDSGSFEPEEIVASGDAPTDLTDTPFTLTLPEDAELGTHRMRVRGADITYAGDVSNPCDDLEYGRTNDYTAEVINSLGVDQEDIKDLALQIVEGEKNKFHISLSTTEIREDMAFYVYNLLGQTLVYNGVSNEGGKYEYDLDMSYATPGVYIIKLGNKHGGSTKKILVK